MPSKKTPATKNGEAPAAAAPAPRKAEFDFHQYRQKLTPEGFYNFVRLYPRPEGTSTYIYRLTPVIDRALAGIKDTNIEILTAPVIDDEYLLRNHGSGKYHLKFSDANAPKGMTERARTTVEVIDPAVPPLLNPVELVIGAPGNDRYVQPFLRDGWHIENGKLVPPAAGGGDGSATLARTIISEMKGERPAGPISTEALLNRALDVLTERGGGGGGGGENEIDRALNIAARLQPKVDPTQVQLMEVVVGLVKDRRSDDGGRDSLGALRETATFLKELGFAPAGGGAAAGGAAAGGMSSGPGWMGVITALPAILQFGGEFLRQMGAMNAAGGGAAASMAAAGMSAAPAAAPGAMPALAEGADMFSRLGFSLIELQGVCDDAIHSFQKGLSGAEFASILTEGRAKGERLYNALCDMAGDGGAENLLQLVAHIPGLSARFAAVEVRRAELVAWLESFLHAGDAGGGGSVD